VIQKYFALAALIAACGPRTSSHHDGGGDDGDDADTTPTDGDVCRAPQMMILLDRTGTMHRDLSGATPPDTTAGHAMAKFTLAISALDGLLATPGLDQTLRLGLAMFPRDPGGQTCITLSQRLSGSATFMNPSCEVGEVPVSPDLGTASQISTLLDPEVTRLCNTTPTGAGLETVRDALASIALPGIEQYVVLVTDGADFYDSCPTPDPIPLVRELSAAHIRTFIVGFGAQNTTPQGVNPPLLNEMACAGQTAKDFATNCVGAVGGGFTAVDATNGPRLYFDAADGPSLSTALRDVAREVCCGCIF
jgi:hypothetical protein